jgi:hypothetical protein
MAKHTKKAASKSGRRDGGAVVGASLTADDLARLEAFGAREEARNKTSPKRGALLLMVARFGLDVVDTRDGVA